VQTLDGIRFLPVARLNGTLLGLDQRWLGARGLLVVMLLALAAPSGILSREPSLPLWLKLGFSAASVLAVAITTLGHELGHAVVGRLAGLRVRAVVLAPHGGLTIRARSDRRHVNVCTALAGPLANVLLGLACALLAWHSQGRLSDLLWQLAAIQLVSGLVNLLPVGRLDGAHVVAALTTSRQSRPALTTSRQSRPELTTSRAAAA
jgi:Zn-dependent protease